MLWLAPAGLRGGSKLEAYHQSRQPQYFSLSPRCSGTSVRSTRIVAASSPTRCRGSRIFLPCRCGDSGFVSRHKPAEHRIPDVSALPDVEASRITSCRGRRASFCRPHFLYLCCRDCQEMISKWFLLSEALSRWQHHLRVSGATSTRSS